MTRILLLFFLIMLPLIVVGIAHRKKPVILRRVKGVGWGLLVMAFLLFPCFWCVPQQINVRMQKQELLINPDSPEVSELAERFLEEHDNLEGMNIREISRAIREFVLNEITWELDYLIYGMIAHQATTNQVINRGTDDCQGQAVVIASMLIHLDFKYVWVVEAPFHWWVILRDNSKSPLPEGWEKSMDDYYDAGEIEYINRGGRNDSPRWMWADPVLVFNQEETLYPATPIESTWHSYTTGGYWHKQLSPLLLSGSILFLMLALFLLSFFLVGWTSYQSSDKSTSRMTELRIDKKLLVKKWLVLGGFLSFFFLFWALMSLNQATADYGLIFFSSLVSLIIVLTTEPTFWKALKIQD